MRILFLHPNFPAQFRHVATMLAQSPKNQVVFGTKTENNNTIPGVRKVMYAPNRDAHPNTHHYLRSTEDAVLQGQAVYRMCIELKASGFVPDLICGHSGWGPTLFVKDIFPNAPLLSYFEWYYNATGSDADFDPDEPLSADDFPRLRTKNTPIMLDLVNCDWGLSPTHGKNHNSHRYFSPKLRLYMMGLTQISLSPNQMPS